MSDLNVVLTTSKYIELSANTAAYLGSVNNRLIYLTGNTTYVTTSNLLFINNTTINAGGNLFNPYSAPTSYGVVLNSTGNPTQFDSVLAQGTGYPGVAPYSWNSNSNTWTPPYSFTPGNTYYIKAYALISGVYYLGNEKVITLYVYLPGVTTIAASSVLQTSAVFNGNVTSDGNATVSRGFVWRDVPYPIDLSNTISIIGSGSGLGSFSSPVSSLNMNTDYYFRAFAQNIQGTVYGTTLSFTTTDYVLTCSEITGSGGAGVTEYNLPMYDSGGGILIVEINSNSVPDKLEIIHNGTKKATSSMTGPNAGPFDSLNTAPDSTYASSNHWYIGASKGAIPSRQSTFISETGIGDITLTSGMQQFVWWKYTEENYNTSSTAIARISGPNGTAWNIKRRCTSDTIPVGVTTNISEYGDTYMYVDGTYSSDGGNTITEVGVVWSSFGTPIYGEDESQSGTIGSPFSVLINLEQSTQYFVRTYVINGIGISYGEEISFETDAYVPTLITYPYTSLTSTSIVGSGEVLSNFGNPLYERGLELSSPYRLIKDAGTNVGAYLLSITGLTSGSVYSYRAYACSSAGCGYGDYEYVDLIIYSTPPVVINLGDTYGGGIVYYIEDLATTQILHIASPRLSTSAHSWDNSYDLCENYSSGGFSDWRMPGTADEAYLVRQYQQDTNFSNNFIPENATYWCRKYISTFWSVFREYQTVNFRNNETYTYYNGINSTDFYVFAVRKMTVSK